MRQDWNVVDNKIKYFKAVVAQEEKQSEGEL